MDTDANLVDKSSVKIVHDLKYRNPTNILLGYLNINSIRNKFSDLKVLIGKSFDFFTVAETKINDSFPNSKFKWQGYHFPPFRLDCKSNSGGLLTYVKSDIPARKLTAFKLDPALHILPVELRLRETKLLIFSIYRPDRINIDLFFNTLADAIHFYEISYDNIMVIGDFNLEPTDPKAVNFLELNDMSNVIKSKTCFKTKSGTCIDLIFTTSPKIVKKTGTVETGLSDFHKLIFSMLKTKYVKLPPKIIKYRDYKNFNEDQFLFELNVCLTNNIIENYSEFENIFTNIIDRHAPLKTKYLRANNKPHVTKDLRKAIMKRSHLKTLALKSSKPEDMVNYRRQRNLVVKMNKRAKKSYFSSTARKSKHFWDAVKPLFSDKSCAAEGRIQLLQNETLHTNDEDVANIFNSYFNRITDNLEIPNWECQKSPLDPDHTLKSKFEDHPSVREIKSQRNSEEIFEFSQVGEQDVFKAILGLNSSKSVSGNIPTRVLKTAAASCTPILTSCFNECIKSGTFPDRLKLADIIPSFKKGSLTDKANYRPISLLPVVSKIFERLLANQLNAFLEPSFSKLLCGFRKGHSTQHAILNLIRSWKSTIADNLKVGAVLIDLSKAFDCLPHDLLLAKLSAYGLGENSLKLMHSYLSRRKHRVRIGSHLSSWLDIFLGVPQGSILGPLLFNIFINDLFYIIQQISNFADDNTLFSVGSTIDDVNLNLIYKLSVVLEWFKHNCLVANPSKFQLIYPGTCNANSFLYIGNIKVDSVEVVKLLGIKIDSGLSFSPYVTELCKRSNQKLKVLRRNRNYLSEDQAKFLVNAYILSPFTYCPLIWMFCGKGGSSQIEKCHHRALRVLKKCGLDYETLLVDCNVENIHARNLKLLLTEVFKSIHKIGPPIMHDIFKTRQSIYRLRNGHTLALPLYKKYNSVFGVNTFDFRAVSTWNKLPPSIKDIESLVSFKNALKTVSPICTCRSCLCT